MTQVLGMIHCKLKRLLFNLALILPGVINTLPVYSRLLSDPVASNVSNFLIQNISGRSQILPLIGTDADGTISSFKILSLPAASAGKLYLNNALVTVNWAQIPLRQQNDFLAIH